MKQGNVICGDFNAVPDKDLDLSSDTSLQQRRATLDSIISSSGLYDIWSCQHSSEKDFTFFSNVHHTYSRIDLFLTDKFLLQQVVKSEIHCITWSDHAPISISVGDHRAAIRASRWRNDINTLSQPTHSNQIGKALTEFFNINAPSVDDPFTLWNTHKVYIRCLLIRLSAKVKKQCSERLNELLTEIRRLEILNKQNTTQTIRETLPH